MTKISFPFFCRYRQGKYINPLHSSNIEQFFVYVRSAGEYVAISCDKPPWFCVSVWQVVKSLVEIFFPFARCSKMLSNSRYILLWKCPDACPCLDSALQAACSELFTSHTVYDILLSNSIS